MSEGPASRDAWFRQAAWTYASYGVVYWLGGLALAGAGLGPRGMERSRAAWFVVGALFAVGVPWLLHRERAWFARWVLCRRDLARILTLLVALRAVEMARLVRAPRVEAVPVLGVEVSMRAGAAAFGLLTLATAVVLGRAAWGRPG